MKNLVIVESPAKAKTIEKYLGKDFKVTSSVGHIRAIAKKTKDGTPPIDVDNNFKTTYEVDADKKKIITQLKKDVKQAETVWLATDEDREGEAIAWHLCEVLKLDPKDTKRIVFHEITKDAITNAVKKPRNVDMNLVAAQQARQILDRIVGFELSPVVWKKVPGGKSAGRVQSPAVRLLVEREREITKFMGSSTFKVSAELLHKDGVVKAELAKKLETEEEAKDFLDKLKSSTLSVSDVSKKPSTRNPSAPFTTSTLQQEANAKLGFSSKSTMSAAQKLYQDGKITYMRTDSVNLSSQAIASCASFIKKSFGEDYVQVRKFKNKSSNAQEAHEAIRPTDVSLLKASSNAYDQKLYDLIRRRTLASQMSSAKIEKTTATIKVSGDKRPLEAKGEVVLFEGFLKAYSETKKETVILPAFNTGDQLELKQATARQTFARPMARYTEGSLVKKLEDLGIGRPSTYTSIIGTIQLRGYAEKGDGEGEDRDVIVLEYAPEKADETTRKVVQEKTGSTKGKLVPTASGELIADFLINHFDKVVDYGFTAKVEEEFDQIAKSTLDRNKMLANFYKPFHELVENSGGIDRSSVAKSREIGLDPKTKLPIVARFARFGPVLQMGDPEDKDVKLRFAPMPKGKKIESITLDEALHAFKLPRVLGKTKEGQEIKANIGRFGPYIQVDKLFVSIKPLDPYEITLAEAKQLYAEKLKAEAAKNIADFGDGIKILNGRFGPYVTDGKKNTKIAKDVDPAKITHEEAKKILKEAPAKRKVPKRKKK